MMRFGSSVALLLGLMLLATTPAPAQNPAPPQIWDFTVTLDGTPIGTHRFRLTRDPSFNDGWLLEGEASYTVKLLGIVVFRYHHAVEEHWGDGCLAALSADTNDDGDMSRVRLTGTSAGGVVTRAGSKQDKTETSWTGCLMSFAYWNPALRRQTRLLNPQTGEIEPVTITPDQTATVSVHGQTVPAQSWRIVGRHEPIDVWYTASGDWVGLDATVKGGRVLSYRLR